MNIFTNLLSEVIGLTILHSLWQITLLWIVLVAVLRLWPTASSTARYRLSVSTLILCTLATATTALYEWQLHATSKEVSVATHGTVQTMHAVYVTVKQTFLSRTVNALSASVPLLAWLWCAGLVVMGARFCGSLFYLRKLRAQKNLDAISSVWEQELDRLSKAIGIKRNIAVATSARVSTPLTLGSIAPIILLPTALLSGLSAAQVEAILIHELYHIKRHDYIVNVCQALVEVLLFYHPAIWHINRIIREERETCCDDQTVRFCGNPVEYARALTHIQEINTFTKPTLAMSATGSDAGNFTNRIKRLFHVYPNASRTRSKGIFALGFLIVYVSIVVTSANISTAKTAEQETRLSTTIKDDHSISADSLPVDKTFYIVDEKVIKPRPVTGKKIHSMDIQHPDTTLAERTLDNCLRQVKLLLKTASIPGQRFKLPEFADIDSLYVLRSLHHPARIALQHRPAGFHGTANRSAATQLDLTSLDENDTSKRNAIHVKVQYATPLFVVDGVPIDHARSYIELEKIPPASINSISVYKGQQAIDLYGDAAKDGVIDIRLKPGTLIKGFMKDVAVEVFPNATSGYLNINFTPSHNNTRVKMTLIDSDGNVTKEITDAVYDNVPSSLRIDLSGHKKGIYILQINIDGAKSQQRVVVE